MNLINVVCGFLKEHKSEIAFGAGVVLTGTTTVLAVGATPKAMDSIKEETAKQGRELSVWEKVKASWKHYILPVTTEVLGLTCLFYGKSVDMKATGAAIALADTSQKLLKTYSEKVVEEIGEKKEAEVRKAVIEERAKAEEPIILGSEECCLMDGDGWFYDPLFGKKFISSDVKIKAALNAFNEKMLSEDSACLNDFFDEIYSHTRVPVNHDLMCDFGDAYGFDIENGLIDIQYEPLDCGIRVNGVKTPAFAITFVRKTTGQSIFPKLLLG